MMRHTTVNLDEDLVMMAKTIGGRGIITTLCNDTLREFVEMNFDNSSLSNENKRKIANIRAKYNKINTENEIIRESWTKFIRPKFEAAIARNGMKKTMMGELIENAKNWIIEKYDRLPTDTEIDETFKEIYKEQYYDFQLIRAILFTKQRILADERIKSEEEQNEVLETWIEKNLRMKPTEAIYGNSSQ